MLQTWVTSKPDYLLELGKELDSLEAWTKPVQDDGGFLLLKRSVHMDAEYVLFPPGSGEHISTVCIANACSFSGNLKQQKMLIETCFYLFFKYIYKT